MEKKGLCYAAAAIAVVIIAVLAIYMVFQHWVDRERHRKAEECLASQGVKWDRTVNLPVAPHGDAPTDVLLPPKRLFADISIRDEKGALRQVPKASMEGANLSVINHEIRACDVEDALKRLTGMDRVERDGFGVFIRADKECGHQYVASFINDFNTCGIWDVSIVARASNEPGDARLTSFKILRLCPCPLPEEDQHILWDPDPFDEDDLSQSAKPCSLGQRLTFWVGRCVEGSLDGVVLYCDKRASLVELDNVLAKLAADPETVGKTVAIRCSEDSPHQALVNVLDALYKHSFKRVYLISL